LKAYAVLEGEMHSGDVWGLGVKKVKLRIGKCDITIRLIIKEHMHCIEVE
jgi:hypothetical protein